MKRNYIKISFNSNTVKIMSERVNILSWAVGGLNYLGFDLQGLTKIITIGAGWLLLQYVSFALLEVSETLKKEENNGTN